MTITVTTANPAEGGAIWVAPSGTTLPSSIEETLSDDYKCLGVISEDGIDDANSRTSDNIKGWGGQTEYTYQSEKVDTYKYTMIEPTNVNVLKEVYGDDNVTGDLSTGIEALATAEELPEKVYVIDEVLASGVLQRTVIPRGKISAVDNSTHNSSTALGYPVTVTALPYSGFDKKATHKKWIKEPSTTSDTE